MEESHDCARDVLVGTASVFESSKPGGDLGDEAGSVSSLSWSWFMADVSTVIAGVRGRRREEDGRLDASMAALAMGQVWVYVIVQQNRDGDRSAGEDFREIIRPSKV